jgi:acyl-homoserine lactone synthase
MVEIHVVTDANRFMYTDALEQSQRLRYRIYVEELKWKGLRRRDDGRETDQFDTGEAVHLLAIEGGGVVGGTRVLSSVEPHLLSEVFPHLAEVRGVPRREDVAEWTRFYVAPERREEHKASQVGSTILASLVEYALDEGMSALSVVLNTFWLPRFLGYRWQVQPLGLPQVHDGEWLVAALISIGPDALANIRAVNSLDNRSALVRRGPQRPLVGARPRRQVA